MQGGGGLYGRVGEPSSKRFAVGGARGVRDQGGDGARRSETLLSLCSSRARRDEDERPREHPRKKVASLASTVRWCGHGSSAALFVERGFEANPILILASGREISYYGLSLIEKMLLRYA